VKQILGILNNDFFYLVKDWLENVNDKMKLEEKGKIEVKYIDGFLYLAYPVYGTINEAVEDLEWTGTNSVIHIEDNKMYVAVRYNTMLADMFEYQMDPHTKGNI
jgi:hypothetical protein